MSLTLPLIVLGFIVADYITGVVAAIATKSLQSSIMRSGAWHKVGEVLLIALAMAGERCLPMAGIEVSIPFVSAVCTYLIVMEIASIIENILKLNPDLSKATKNIFGPYIDNEQEDKGKHEQ